MVYVRNSTAFRPISAEVDTSRLLFDLKLCGELINRLASCTESIEIATTTTNGLTEQFGCAFARIWLVEPHRQSLKLVASSGLYTRLDGAFAQVPMGAFKVGKIAEHCIPFLSNCLPKEAWVKDRQWAIDNGIQGFAGLPLMMNNRSIGVLAVFSHTAMAAEFLEVLQILSLSVAHSLAGARDQTSTENLTKTSVSLAEQLAGLLGTQRLSLIGTEQALAPPISLLLLNVGKKLARLSCNYCRLTYEPKNIILEAMLAVEDTHSVKDHSTEFETISATVHKLGGQLQIQGSMNERVSQIRLSLPQQIANDKEQIAEQPSPLSEREEEVMHLLIKGLRDKEISERLYISDRTVKFHVKNALIKLNVRTRVQGVFEATKKGWLS